MIFEQFNIGITIRGEILPDGKPIVDFWIEPLQQFVRGLIDTGATDYSIEKSLAESLNLQFVDTERKGYLVKDEPIEVDVYKMQFRISGMMDYLLTEEFNTIPFNYMYPIIIGTKFLKRCKSFNIDYENKMWEIEL